MSQALNMRQILMVFLERSLERGRWKSTERISNFIASAWGARRRYIEEFRSEKPPIQSYFVRAVGLDEGVALGNAQGIQLRTPRKPISQRTGARPPRAVRLSRSHLHIQIDTTNRCC